jgi:hypothetical protein
MGKAYSHRLIASAKVAREIMCEDRQEVSPIGDKHDLSYQTPQTESQVRPLTDKRLTPEDRKEAWSEAVDESNGKAPTGIVAHPRGFRKSHQFRIRAVKS